MLCVCVHACVHVHVCVCVCGVYKLRHEITLLLDAILEKVVLVIANTKHITTLDDHEQR